MLLVGHLLPRAPAQPNPARRRYAPAMPPGGAQTAVPLLITAKQRKSVAVNYFNANVWKPALARAGVILSTTTPRVGGGVLYTPPPENGFHVLRHTYASVMLQAGEPIHAVARWLGHADPAITLRAYAHLMPEAGTRGIAALENEWLN